MRVYLSRALFEDKVVKVKEFLDNELLFNCELSGATYKIVWDDYTWIDEVDEIVGSKLLDKILDI